MSDTHDVAIVGAGPGGYNCAIRCGQLGLDTVIVERDSTLGGTCLNVGCIPSKALLHHSHIYETVKSGLAGTGVRVGEVGLDLAEMMARKNDAVKGLTQGVAYLMRKRKVKVVHGEARLAGPGRLAVSGGDTPEVRARNIVIATGSEPASLPGIDIDEKRIVSNTGALSLTEVPKRLILIGAGVIGLEMGSVWSRLGAKVIVMEYLDRILPGADAEIAEKALKTFSAQGLEFRLGRKVTGVEKLATTVKVASEPVAGGDGDKLNANIVVVAVGRRPLARGLDLEKVDAKIDDQGFIATPAGPFRAAEGVWAIGDCIRGPMLAHKAEEDGVAVAELIAGKPGHVDYDLVPSVVYTEPEIAWIGKTEEELKSADVPYKTGKFPFTANSRARATHDTEGLVKMLAHAETDRILGAHMIGSGVGELMSSVSVAMAMGAASEDVARTCHAHPTMSEAVRQAAMGVEGWTMQM